MRFCPACKQHKEHFWKGQCYCVDCNRAKQKHVWNSRTPVKRLEQHLRYKYGVALADFYSMLSTQQGNCAICETQLPDLLQYDGARRGYAVDHNHETGKVRGVLCTNCNSLLGMAGDSTTVLQNAITYLNVNGSYDNMRAAKKKK